MPDGTTPGGAGTDRGLIAHAERVMLCARSDSPFLRKMVGDLLQGAWFEALSIDENRLSAEERAQVEFIFAGLVAVLGSPEAANSPLVMRSVAESEVGRAAVATLEGMAGAQAAG